MNLQDEIKKRVEEKVEIVQTKRVEGRVELTKSVLCQILRLAIPNLPEDKFVSVGVDRSDEIDEYNPLIVTWDKLEKLEPVVTSDVAQPGTPAFALQVMEQNAMAESTNVDVSRRRFRYFYVLDGILGKGDLTYEELKDLVNTGGFLGDFLGPERDTFADTAEICDEFATGNGIVMRVKDANA